MDTGGAIPRLLDMRTRRRRRRRLVGMRTTFWMRFQSESGSSGAIRSSTMCCYAFPCSSTPSSPSPMFSRRAPLCTGRQKVHQTKWLVKISDFPLVPGALFRSAIVPAASMRRTGWASPSPRRTPPGMTVIDTPPTYQTLSRDTPIHLDNTASKSTSLLRRRPVDATSSSGTRKRPYQRRWVDKDKGVGELIDSIDGSSVGNF